MPPFERNLDGSANGVQLPSPATPSGSAMAYADSPRSFASEVSSKCSEDMEDELMSDCSPVSSPMPDAPVSPELRKRHDAESTVVIFDWDDTLLSSTWLSLRGLRLDSPAVVPADAAAQLDTLGGSVVQLLMRAMSYGEVVIITNAETGWVELSARKFMPAVVPLLSKVRVVSARSTYEPMYPDSPSDWKLAAFQCELTAAGAARRGALRHVLSFGDSVHERTAIHEATRKLEGALTKSVKFVERPSLEQLKRQVELVGSCFDDICSHDGHLDLMLTISLLEQPTAPAGAPAPATAGAAPTTTVTA